MAPPSRQERWPVLPWRDWAPTLATVHMWSQIVGKLRLALAPPLNHWWHITLHVSGRGLTTSPIPYEGRHFQVDFDLVDHRLLVIDSGGATFADRLEPKSVARFYRELMAGLKGIGIDVRVWPHPVEVADAVPFPSDDEHRAYDREHATAFWRGLVQADRVMKDFQTGFIGKVSPVHLFWGGFDLATSRYSGRAAPRHPGGVVNCPDWVQEEAYSREESAIGWWPLDERFGPAFYAYTYPEPDGLRSTRVEPEEAFFDQVLGEFILPYDAIHGAADGDAKVLEFFESTYRAGADLGRWDRRALEPAARPGRPPTRAWSLTG
ncbi:MAG: DUF5996 family protein [Chloroflexota bacterium]